MTVVGQRPSEVAGGVARRDERAVRRGTWVAHLGTLLLFGVFTLALAPRVMLHPSTMLAPDPIDPVYNVWAVALADHNVTTLPDGLWSFFDGNIYYPTPHAALYTDAFVGLLPLSLPLGLLLHDPVALTNALVALAFVLSAYGAFLLGCEVTRRYGAGMVAGLIYGFSPLQIEQTGHLNVLGGAQWLVFGAYCVVRAWRTGSWRWWATSGMLLGLAAMTSLYYLAYLGLPLCCMVVLLRREWSASRAWGAALAVSVCALLVVPFVLSYLARRATIDAGYGAASPTDILSFVHVLGGRVVDRQVLPAVPFQMMQPSHGLFPGFTALALAVVAWRHRLARRWALWSSLCVALALGPSLNVGGHVLPLPLPYAWVETLIPHFAVFRDPLRAMSGAYLGLAVLAAWGAYEVAAWVPITRRRAWMNALMIGLVALELWSPVPTVSVPPIPDGERWLALQRDIHVIVELPITSRTPVDWERQTAIVYDSTAHWKTLVNGTGSIDPDGMAERRATLATYPSPASLRLLRQLRVDAVVLRLAWLTSQERAAARSLCHAAFDDGTEEICVGPWT